VTRHHPGPVSRAIAVVVVLAVVLAGLTLIDTDRGTAGPQIPVSATGTDWPATSAAPDEGGAAIVAVAPNPVADEDVGESITLRVPTAPARANYSIADGESTAWLPAANVSGTVVVSTAPAAVRNRSPHPVLALRGRLSLANGGERLTLRRNGSVVDTVTYPAVGEAEVYRNGSVVPAGMTDHPVWATGATRATAFVLPDAAAVPARVLAGAEDRLYLAGYTLTSHRVATRLVAAARRGVDVRVLIEGGPAGGTSNRSPRVVDRLRAAGVAVRVVDGPRSRWRFHHAKYAVVDDRALVLTENWQPAGTGGHATRGWGVAVTDAAIADRLATVFTGDHGWRGTRSWPRFEAATTFQPPSPASGSFAQRFPPETTRVEGAAVLVAPDNAERRLLAMIRDAEESIRVLQPSIGNRTPLLAAVVNAARRGVRVKILLGGTWFLEDENRYLRDRLRRIAAAENLPLAVRLLEPRSRFEYLHAKGLIVDGDQVVVGSINWNTVSTRENREVALLLEGRAVARYYRRVFRADWRGAAWRVTVGVVGVTAAIVAVTVVVLARVVTFGGRPVAPRRSRRHPSSRRGRRERPPASRERT